MTILSLKNSPRVGARVPVVYTYFHACIHTRWLAQCKNSRESLLSLLWEIADTALGSSSVTHA